LKYTLKESREILGVNKGSSKEDIEKRYDVALKRYRHMKNEGTLNEQGQAEFEKSTDAYRILMGYEVDEPKVETKETYVDKAFEKAGIDRKKAGNFFYYYKFHILAIIIAIALVAGIVYSFVTKVNPDITIGLMGNVNSQATEVFETKIKKDMPELKDVAFDSAMLSDNPNDPNGFVNVQKALILISAADIDLFVVNRYVYEKYAPEGPFMALEVVAGELGIDTKSSEYLKLRVVEEWNKPKDMESERTVKEYRDTEPKLYGIDVTNSEFFKDVNVVGPEKILVVRAEPDKRDLVLKLLKLFSK
jgi:predicted GNAT family acetyltransferase